jgi:hypothetical protein
MMPRDQRDILDVLKSELDFLEKDGYGRSPREPWRAQLSFEDSPTCMNYDRKQNPRPCRECVLMQFVPPKRRAEKLPCRHIPLTQAGETLFDLYREGTQQEIEDAIADWLRNTIAQLEAQRAKETGAKIAAGPQEKIKALAAH